MKAEKIKKFLYFVLGIFSYNSMSPFSQNPNYNVVPEENIDETGLNSNEEEIRNMLKNLVNKRPDTAIYRGIQEQETKSVYRVIDQSYINEMLNELNKNQNKIVIKEVEPINFTMPQIYKAEHIKPIKLHMPTKDDMPPMKFKKKCCCCQII
jgi:hypothetical protein